MEGHATRAAGRRGTASARRAHHRSQHAGPATAVPIAPLVQVRQADREGPLARGARPTASAPLAGPGRRRARGRSRAPGRSRVPGRPALRRLRPAARHGVPPAGSCRGPPGHRRGNHRRLLVELVCSYRNRSILGTPPVWLHMDHLSLCESLAKCLRFPVTTYQHLY